MDLNELPTETAVETMRREREERCLRMEQKRKASALAEPILPTPVFNSNNQPVDRIKSYKISLPKLPEGKAPFEIVEGGKKVPPILQTKDKIFEADKYVQNTDEAYRKIKLALEKTQSKQKKAADRHCRELVFSLGDKVPLRFEKARLRKMKGKERLFPKLGMRYYGPFQVCDKISDVAYRLKLPEGWKIHNAFHVSLLRPFVGDVPEDMV
ncbi:hypothetical protein L7F22_027321 [Adiantum nelumboides]|nr:hypothetical protein [Adiantum nelumboides]